MNQVEASNVFGRSVADDYRAAADSFNWLRGGRYDGARPVLRRRLSRASSGVGGGAVAGGFIGYLASIRWRDRIGLSLGTQRAFWVGHTILAAIVILLTFLTAVKTGSRFFYLMSVWMVLSELFTHSIRRDYPCATVTLALLATVVGLCMSLMHPIFLVLVFFSGGAAVKEIRRLRAGGGVV